MPVRRGVLVSVGVIVWLAGSWSAEATMENFKSYKQAYPAAKVSCKTCHLNAVGRKGELNAYGLALQKSKAPADAKELTKQDIRAIEKQDADGDGVSNLDEINAGTAPGDPTAVPAGQPASSATHDTGAAQQKEAKP